MLCSSFRSSLARTLGSTIASSSLALTIDKCPIAYRCKTFGEDYTFQIFAPLEAPLANGGEFVASRKVDVEKSITLAKGGQGDAALVVCV